MLMMNLGRPSLGAISLSLLAQLVACSTTISFTKSAANTYPPKASNCTLELLTVPPQRPFVQVGTFDIQARTESGMIRTADKLLDSIRSRACQEGADAVIAEKQDGEYEQASAIRWVESPPPMQ
jgi:hypothetical protein